jgi:hypothetical protein
MLRAGRPRSQSELCRGRLRHDRVGRGLVLIATCKSDHAKRAALQWFAARYTDDAKLRSAEIMLSRLIQSISTALKIPFFAA